MSCFRNKVKGLTKVLFFRVGELLPQVVFLLSKGAGARAGRAQAGRGLNLTLPTAMVSKDST